MFFFGQLKFNLKVELDINFELIHKWTIAREKVLLLCAFSLGYEGRIHEKGDATRVKNKGLITVLCHF